MAPKPTRAAIYCRISDDREGAGLGVKRQEADCRELCERRGWTVAEVYADNDLSAYRGRERPAYRRMMADLEDGSRDAMVAWHVDRLTRRPRELEDVIDAFERAHFQMACVTGDIDLGTHTGRLIARNLGAAAAYESDQKSERVRRKMLELAQQGKSKGGGKRPFGFEPDGRTVRDSEAVLIREAASRLLAGEGLHGVCSDWERRGIKTTTSRPWGARPLKRVMTSGRIAGLRDHLGVTVAKAEWPAIIDEGTHDRLKIMLENPARWTNGGVMARRYLLTGIAYCSLCDSRLIARPRENTVRSYSCLGGPEGQRAHLRIVADPLEEFVRDAVIEAWSSPALDDALRAAAEGNEQAELLEQMRADEAALKQLAHDLYLDRGISRSAFISAKATLERRIEQTRKRLASTTSGNVLAGAPSGRIALEKAWEERDLEWRRGIVGAVVEKVVIGPAVRGRNFFDIDRVQITWRV